MAVSAAAGLLTAGDEQADQKLKIEMLLAVQAQISAFDDLVGDIRDQAISTYPARRCRGDAEPARPIGQSLVEQVTSGAKAFPFCDLWRATELAPALGGTMLVDSSDRLPAPGLAKGLR